LSADNETSSSLPALKTTKDLERHVGEIYTYANFISSKISFGMLVWTVRLKIDKQQMGVLSLLFSIILETWLTKGKLYITHSIMWHIAHVRYLSVKVSLVTYCVF